MLQQALGRLGQGPLREPEPALTVVVRRGLELRAPLRDFNEHHARGGKQPGTAQKDKQVWLKGQLHKMTPTRQVLCREAFLLPRVLFTRVRQF